MLDEKLREEIQQTQHYDRCVHEPLGGGEAAFRMQPPHVDHTGQREHVDQAGQRADIAENSASSS